MKQSAALLSMHMQPVSSSNIHSVGHDPETKTLRVRFSNGNTYEYPNISAEQHAALMAAPSKGAHFAREIRNHPEHPHRKLASNTGLLQDLAA